MLTGIHKRTGGAWAVDTEASDSDAFQNLVQFQGYTFALLEYNDGGMPPVYTRSLYRRDAAGNFTLIQSWPGERFYYGAAMMLARTTKLCHEV